MVPVIVSLARDAFEPGHPSKRARPRSAMNVLTGDETGLVKLVNVEAKTLTKYSSITDDNSAAVQSRNLGVKGMCWMGGSKDSFSTIRSDGVVDIWRYQHEASHSYLMKSFSTFSEGKPVGIVAVPAQGSFTDAQQMLSYEEGGNVSVDSFACIFNDSSGYKSTASRDSSKNLAFTVKAPLATCVTCNEGGVLFGGRENDLQMFDLTSISSSSSSYSSSSSVASVVAEPVWKAKNVPHDFLNLRVPIWITDMRILKPEESSVSKAHVVCGTGHKHIRVYDTLASNQPVLSLDIGGEYRVTSVCPKVSGESVYIGDVAGNVYEWDLRMQRKLFTLKGFAGSVRSMNLSTEGKYLACVGLDRYLRVYDTTGNKMVDTFYLKNRLNQCLVAGDIGGKNLGKASAKEKAGGDEEEEEDEGGEDILRDFVDSDEEGDSDGEEDEEDDEDEEEEEDEEDEEDEEEEEDKEEEDKEHDSRAERNKKRSVSDSATSKQNQGQMMKGNSSKGKEKGKKARR